MFPYSPDSRRLLLRCNGSWQERVATQGVRDGVNDGLAIFASSRDVRADGAEGPGSRLSAEGARDFLLEFDHAHIPFSLVVVKRHSEIVHEGERLGFIGLEAVQQVFGFGLFGSAPPRVGFQRGRIGGKPLGQDFVVTSFEIGEGG